MTTDGSSFSQNSQQNEIQSIDFRQAQFYFRWMRYFRMLPNNNRLGHYPNCKELVLFLNNYLVKHEPDFLKRSQIIMNMEQSFLDNIVPESEFDWLKNSVQACYWLWGIFKTIPIDYLAQPPYKPKFPFLRNRDGEFIISDPQGFIQESRRNNSALLEWDLVAFSHAERLNQIIYCFDISNDYEQSSRFHSKKKNFLNSKKIEWSSIQNRSDIFKWLDKNNGVQCQWAWEYMESSSGFLRIFGDALVTSFLSPDHTTSEIYLAVCTAYNAWDPRSSDTKTLFMQKMRKAWSQKKFRSKNEENAPLNTYIKKELKQNLDWLAEWDNKNLKDVLERLIRQEYEARKNGR